MITNDIYTDPHVGTANTLKLREDIENLGLNKLCMTEVLNADLSIAAYGEEVYYAGCKDVLDNAQLALEQTGLDKVIRLYSFNYKNFVLAGTEHIPKEQFLEVMKQFYAQFESAASEQVEVSAVSRFVVVLQPDRLIERALHALLEAKETQENFVVAPEVLDIATTVKEDAKILDLINFAMDENRIIPFYQGIHNNATGKIEKYEALMRIKDKDEKIHSPYVFLDIAKKYKIYNRISQMMIAAALSNFENRPEQLSINISAYDIENDTFRKWFYKKLETYPNSHNLVIEFVETENYQNGMLFEFIKTIRQYGCKVSADDFGSGYATYTAVISLSPAFIKIDGTIIKDVAKAKENVIILRSICYMANLIGAKTIAEFVENEEIQAILEKYGVDYSQGYLFSKPQPIECLPQV